MATNLEKERQGWPISFSFLVLPFERMNLDTLVITPCDPRAWKLLCCQELICS